MRQPGHAPPCLRRDPGDDKEPRGPRPATGARAPWRPPALRQGPSAPPPCGSRRPGPRTSTPNPRPVAARLPGERGTAPGAASRPAPSSAKLGTLTVVIEGSSLPGLSWPADAGGEYDNVHIALSAKSTERSALVVPGKPWLATEPVPGDSPWAYREVPVTVRRQGRLRLQRTVRARRPHRPPPLFSPRATCPATGRCGWSAAASSGWPVSIPASSRKPCAPGHRLLARDPADRRPGRTRPHLRAGPADVEPSFGRAGQVGEPGRQGDFVRPPSAPAGAAWSSTGPASARRPSRLPRPGPILASVARAPVRLNFSRTA